MPPTQRRPDERACGTTLLELSCGYSLPGWWDSRGAPILSMLWRADRMLPARPMKPHPKVLIADGTAGYSLALHIVCKY